MKEFNKTIDKLYLASIDHFVNWRRHVKEYFWAILIALALRSMVITIYTIPTGSMIPTLEIGDILIANRFYYGIKVPFTDNLDGYRIKGIREPEVGDVVIFRSPGEQRVYHFQVNVNSSEGTELLNKINQEAGEYKRYISIEKDYTNYIFASGNAETSARINVPEQVFKRYEREIYDSNNNALTASHAPYFIPNYGMTYHDNQYSGFFRTMIDGPLKGLSITGTVLLKTPMLLHVKILLVYLTEIFSSDYQKKGLIERFKGFSLFPNRYVDMTKDYVKRVVAKEGDTIQMKDKILYVNGKKRELEMVEGYDGLGTHNAYRTTYTTGTSRGMKTKTNLLRHRKSNYSSVIYGKEPFDKEAWPYDANVEGSPGASYRDQLGPIKVPKGHYFVLGDNRDDSLDSRYWGFLPRWAIKGTPMFKLNPFKRIE